MICVFKIIWFRLDLLIKALLQDILTPVRAPRKTGVNICWLYLSHGMGKTTFTKPTLCHHFEGRAVIISKVKNVESYSIWRQ